MYQEGKLKVQIKQMSAKKYSKIYMLDVRANGKDKVVIESLINSCMETIKLVSKTAKVSRNDMDRQE